MTTTYTIASLTAIRYTDGYIEIAQMYRGDDEMAEAIADVEKVGFTIVEPAVNWGYNTHVIIDGCGGYYLAKLESTDAN